MESFGCQHDVKSKLHSLLSRKVSFAFVLNPLNVQVIASWWKHAKDWVSRRTRRRKHTFSLGILSLEDVIEKVAFIFEGMGSWSGALFFIFFIFAPVYCSLSIWASWYCFLGRMLDEERDESLMFWFRWISSVCQVLNLAGLFVWSFVAPLLYKHLINLIMLTPSLPLSQFFKHFPQNQ